MIYNEKLMVDALAVLEFKRPELIEALAAGPEPEPWCGVCSTLLEVANGREPGYQAALTVLMFHDEPTYEVDHEHYLRAIGLADIFTYNRCLDVYAVAFTLLHWRRSSPPGVETPESPGSSPERRPFRRSIR